MSPEALRLTALVVDDEPTIRFLCVQTLQLAGFRVEEAADAATALASLQEKMVDALLVDARLPDLNGFELCAAIRRLPEGARVPLLIMTGMDVVQMGPRAREVGADGIISKPLNLATLGPQVRRLAERTAAPPCPILQDAPEDR
jgi:DNA-binding response OmpR family regulator